ncbi:hypothetical protein TNIN_80931 [Trichonephila inaurata madagascariensis]|uniref:Uncharacterized protein n=1 Tax=Trichonephila inaurata madagascariensis TaxID=2747483 RepID=A0A8X7BYK3_9ARAC|nr:hypothetical protein TNIN_80931 [Trichonephila inaurata madagascariensis]
MLLDEGVIRLFLIQLRENLHTHSTQSSIPWLFHARYLDVTKKVRLTDGRTATGRVALLVQRRRERNVLLPPAAFYASDSDGHRRSLQQATHAVPFPVAARGSPEEIGHRPRRHTHTHGLGQEPLQTETHEIFIAFRRSRNSDSRQWMSHAELW